MAETNKAVEKFQKEISFLPIKIQVGLSTVFGRDFGNDLESAVRSGDSKLAEQIKEQFEVAKEFVANLTTMAGSVANTIQQLFMGRDFGSEIGAALRQGDVATAKHLSDQFAASADATASLIQKFQAKMGKLGDVWEFASKGFTAGGVWGSVLAVLGDLFTDSEQFKQMIALVDMGFKKLSDVLGKLLEPAVKLSAAGNDVLNEFLNVFGPSLEMLAQLFEPIGTLLEGLAMGMKALGPIVEGLEFIFGLITQALSWLHQALYQGLFYSIRNTAIAILWVGRAFVDASNWLSQGFKDLLNSIGDIPLLGGAKKLADGILVSSEAHDRLTSMMDRLSAVTWDAADAQSKQSEAVQKATTSVQQFSEALTNVPTGFKVEGVRYNSSDSIAGSAASGTFQRSQQGLTVNVNVDGNVLGLNDLIDQLTEAIRLAQQRRAGAAGF
jgi:hypothetical protein